MLEVMTFDALQKEIQGKVLFDPKSLEEASGDFGRRVFKKPACVVLPKNAVDVVGGMIEKGFAAGFPLGRYYKGMDNYLLVAVTEKRTKEEIVRFAESLEAVLWS